MPNTNRKNSMSPEKFLEQCSLLRVDSKVLRLVVVAEFLLLEDLDSRFSTDHHLESDWRAVLADQY